MGLAHKIANKAIKGLKITPLTIYISLLTEADSQ